MKRRLFVGLVIAIAMFAISVAAFAIEWGFEATEYKVPLQNVEAIAQKDINGDGVKDIAIADGQLGQLTFLVSEGDELVPYHVKYMGSVIHSGGITTVEFEQERDYFWVAFTSAHSGIVRYGYSVNATDKTVTLNFSGLATDYIDTPGGRYGASYGNMVGNKSFDWTWTNGNQLRIAEAGIWVQLMYTITEGTVLGQPLLANLDGDSIPEIVAVGLNTDMVYVWWDSSPAVTTHQLEFAAQAAYPVALEGVWDQLVIPENSGSRVLVLSFTTDRSVNRATQMNYPGAQFGRVADVESVPSNVALITSKTETLYVLASRNGDYLVTAIPVSLPMDVITSIGAEVVVGQRGYDFGVDPKRQVWVGTLVGDGAPVIKTTELYLPFINR